MRAGAILRWARPVAAWLSCGALGSAACGGDEGGGNVDTVNIEDTSAAVDVDGGRPGDVDTAHPDSVVPRDEASADGAEGDVPDAEPAGVPELGSFIEAEVDGEVVSGELVARYALEEPLWAIFSAERFAPWPDDRSIRVVRQPQSRQWRRIPARAPTFTRWRRDVGLSLTVPMVGATYVMAGHERHHLEELGYGDYAFDLGRADLAGRWRGDGLDLSDYLSWDEEVFAPIAGTVIEVVRDEPDRPIGPPPDDFLALPENLVGLWVTGGYSVYLLHQRQGSIPASLAVGTPVARGEALGRIGNSGTSLEPHVHVVLLYYEPTWGRTFSVPVSFGEVYLSSSPSGGTQTTEVAPLSGMWLSNTPF